MHVIKDGKCQSELYYNFKFIFMLRAKFCFKMLHPLHFCGKFTIVPYRCSEYVKKRSCESSITLIIILNMRRQKRHCLKLLTDDI